MCTSSLSENVLSLFAVKYLVRLSMVYHDYIIVIVSLNNCFIFTVILLQRDYGQQDIFPAPRSDEAVLRT